MKKHLLNSMNNTPNLPWRIHDDLRAMMADQEVADRIEIVRDLDPDLVTARLESTKRAAQAKAVALLSIAFEAMPDVAVERTNQWGSGISLGHPVGCTGARQAVDMIHQLRRRDKEVGLVSRCVGGGIGGGELLIRM